MRVNFLNIATIHYMDIPINEICAYRKISYINQFGKEISCLKIWYNQNDGHFVEDNILEELEKSKLFKQIELRDMNDLFINTKLLIAKHREGEYDYLEFRYELYV